MRPDYDATNILQTKNDTGRRKAFVSLGSKVLNARAKIIQVASKTNDTKLDVEMLQMALTVIKGAKKATTIAMVAPEKRVKFFESKRKLLRLKQMRVLIARS